MRPRLLDLFCGAGGAAMGYHRAGFDVVGVDIRPQPNYPFYFSQDDALEVLSRLVRKGGPIEAEGERFMSDDFDAIHASPPCQAFSIATLHRGAAAREKHPDLIVPVRAALQHLGMPFVIENVAGAPIRHDLCLCGEMFGLRLHRHRYFELAHWFAMAQPHAAHALEGALHNCDVRDGVARQVVGNYADHESASEAMGIDWMTRRELAEAIPPAYTEFIGEQLLAHVTASLSSA